MINYLIGDATSPVGEDKKYIVHVCNDIGAWGAGFVLALSRKWPVARERYLDWFSKGINPEDFKLGSIQIVRVERDVNVANMVAQRGIRNSKNTIPLRYDALEECLGKIFFKAERSHASVHMPRIGCGLAGGDWNKIEEIILRTARNVPVFVYDLK